MDKLFFPYNIIKEHFVNDEQIKNDVNTGLNTANAGLNTGLNTGLDTANTVNNETDKVSIYIKTILSIIILIASMGMAIYRVKKHADMNKGNYENTGYILGVALISFCCNMCYLPYALVYSFVFKKF